MVTVALLNMSRQFSEQNKLLYIFRIHLLHGLKNLPDVAHRVEANGSYAAPVCLASKTHLRRRFREARSVSFNFHPQWKSNGLENTVIDPSDLRLSKPRKSVFSPNRQQKIGNCVKLFACRKSETLLITPLFCKTGILHQE